MNGAALKKTEAAEFNFAELAQEAVDSTDGTAEAATKWMVEHLLENWPIVESNRLTILRIFSMQHVTTRLSARRRERAGSMQNVVPIDGAAFREAVRSNHTRYMSRPIWGGKPIADCTAEEIYASADQYDKQAQTMTREAAWQAAVAKALEKNGGSSAMQAG